MILTIFFFMIKLVQNTHEERGFMVLLSVLSFVASILYFNAGFNAIKSNRKSELCRTFFYLTLSMTIWSFAWGFIYLAKNTIEYSFWNKISAFGWCTFEALVLYFVMILTENKRIKIWYIKGLILMPAPVFLFMVLFLFGPKINTSPIVETIFYSGNFLYNFIYLAVSILLIFLWGHKSTNKIQIKQAKIIAICSSIPFILNLVAQYILPWLGIMKLPSMGHIFTLIMLGGVNYAIISYQFMSIPSSLVNNELFNELTGLTFLVDSKGIIIKANSQVYKLLDYTKAEINNSHISSIIDNKEIGNILEQCESIHKLVKLQDINILSKAGTSIPFNISIIPLHNKSNLLLGLLLIGEDIRVTKSLQDEIVKHMLTNEKLRISEELFRTILDITPISIVLSSKSTNRILYANTRAEEFFRVGNRELIGTNPLNYYMNPEDRSLILSDLENNKKVSDREIVFIRKDGSQILGLVTTVPSIYQEEEVALTCIIDITEKKRVAEQLQKNNENIEELNKELMKMNDILVNKSIRDSLTNLYNHQYINDVLVIKINEASKTKEDLCIMMLDIDYFKRVNDSFGHQIGDKVLITVAGLIVEYVRKTDYIGRYGGEEFIAVLPNINLEAASRMAERIRANLQMFDFGAEDLTLTISIGVAQYANEKPNELIKKADLLLYQAKDNGRNRVEK
ncbi:MAG: diguanylate cyclase [Desulfitobacteriaceae bacterium]